ncbi:hypothetical protein FIU94_20330 (plasmid) [Sulfitobacter sp. THAF37]|uniref:Zn-ribbon domain-containing OB-fold protein n=1 Tax=Sulfitobacter sp. THAF37 TaxID=2587855 RepID=UPI001267AB24|nr:OB-fold domain-containing protein [Sulfitobacter sp. THAF37]QFT61190.1 hypothetical protein FIU94_20330 [Sulfitobacter sp. THAF37]
MNDRHSDQDQALPPYPQSASAELYDAVAVEGRFALQRCQECSEFLYPAHDVCSFCLSTDLPLVDAPRMGRIASETTIRATTNPYFQQRLPIRIGLVILDCGPSMIAFLDENAGMGDRISVSFRPDAFGRAMAWAE